MPRGVVENQDPVLLPSWCELPCTCGGKIPGRSCLPRTGVKPPGVDLSAGELCHVDGDGPRGRHICNHCAAIMSPASRQIIKAPELAQAVGDHFVILIR